MTFTLNHGWRQRKFIVKKEAITELTLREAFLMTCFISRLGSNEKDFLFASGMLTFLLLVSRHRRSAFFASALTSIIHYFKEKSSGFAKTGKKKQKRLFLLTSNICHVFHDYEVAARAFESGDHKFPPIKESPESFIRKSPPVQMRQLSCARFSTRPAIAAKKIEISLTRLMSGCSLINDLVSA